MSDQIKLYTVADLEVMPDDGMQREIIEGVLIEMPGAKPKHNRIGFLIAKFIEDYLSNKPLGTVVPDIGCELAKDPDTLVFPDVGYVSFARLGDHDLDEYLPFAPDLAVEIKSPSNSARDLSDKTALYLRHGARLVWLFYPLPQRVFVYHANGTFQIVERDGVLNGGDVLPDFELKLSDVFAQ